MKILTLMFLFTAIALAIVVVVDGIEYNINAHNGNTNNGQIYEIRDLYYPQNHEWIRGQCKKENKIIQANYPIIPLYIFILKYTLDELEKFNQTYFHHANGQINPFGRTELTKLSTDTIKCINDLYQTSLSTAGQLNIRNFEKLAQSYEHFFNCPKIDISIIIEPNIINYIFNNLIEFLKYSKFDLMDDKNIRLNKNIWKIYDRILEKHELLQQFEKKLIDNEEKLIEIGHLHYIERIIIQVYNQLFQELIESDNPLYDGHLGNYDSYKYIKNELSPCHSSDDVKKLFEILSVSIDENLLLKWKNIDHDSDDRKCLSRLYGQWYLSYYDNYLNSTLMKIYLIDEFGYFLENCSKSSTLAHINELILLIDRQLVEISNESTKELSQITDDNRILDHKRKLKMLTVLKGKIRQLVRKYPKELIYIDENDKNSFSRISFFCISLMISIVMVLVLIKLKFNLFKFLWEKSQINSAKTDEFSEMRNVP